MDSQSQGLPEKSTPIKLFNFFYFFFLILKLYLPRNLKSVFKVLSFISTNAGA